MVGSGAKSTLTVEEAIINMSA
jgi:hypothetical protein